MVSVFHIPRRAAAGIGQEGVLSRHVDLVADQLWNRSIHPRSFARTTKSPLARAASQEALRFLLEAALGRESDDLTCVEARAMVGLL